MSEHEQLEIERIEQTLNQWASKLPPLDDLHALLADTIWDLAKGLKVNENEVDDTPNEGTPHSSLRHPSLVKAVDKLDVPIQKQVAWAIALLHLGNARSAVKEAEKELELAETYDESIRSLREIAPQEILELLDLPENDRNYWLTVATGPIHAHMQRHVLNPSPSTFEPLTIRQRGHPKQLEAHSTIGLPQGARLLHTPDEMLEQMQQSILKRKANGAALIKTHLHLMDRAFRAGGRLPLFEYNLSEALEDLGHERLSHGSIDPDTLREHYARIATLASQWLSVWEVKGKRREKHVEEAPYWIIQTRRRLEEDETPNVLGILFARPGTPIYTQVTIQPGLWWTVADMGAYHLRIPREVLRLPTDGNGNETERIALKLTATLAVWVRAGQKQHAGKDCGYSVGALLEASGVATYKELAEAVAKENKRPKRIREYLAGDGIQGGAFALLRSLGAFDIDIEDEAAFWAARQGWLGKFWGAKLRVAVPDLQIERVPARERKKRKRK